MPTTANVIINDAAVMGGVGDIYNQADGTQIQQWLRFLNGLIDSWSTEELTIYNIIEGTFTLLPGVATYTNGPLGTGLAVRPPYVEDVSIVDANGITYPVKMIGVDQWSRIIYKPAPGRPEVMYQDGNYPLLSFSFYPTPAFVNDVCHVWYGSQIPSFQTVDQLLVAPIGFELFMKTELAMFIGSANGVEPSESLKRMAHRARKNARALNTQPVLLQTDLPIQRKSFNIFTGQ